MKRRREQGQPALVIIRFQVAIAPLIRPARPMALLPGHLELIIQVDTALPVLTTLTPDHLERASFTIQVDTARRLPGLMARSPDPRAPA